ncbi:Serine/threonine-protein phosphatase 2A regulatory subunit B'' subunit alpha [Phytophthora boehmeriae]|uniref:Serine/threonine-protein phosphatase 2A regulatory subunit B'' subunit alpha n=1 Tax=Phytophthora boehmeriae TaxID=109152 RepID=A0A8T1WR85_9STRA|nr:Serine/threonine-protein phosphatase 2A regulatory subunit B'' subunit alpha [Phytophthora boehmeriae]
MTVEVEASDASMASPTSSSGTGPESLRLSEIESAHLCPAGRMKMEELFRQWLNVDGTKEMIQGMVADLRQGKELNLDALLAATASANGSGADSPSRSPKRPPNYQQFGLLSPGSAGSPSARRRHQHLVSLFGDELTNAAAAVTAAATAGSEASTEEAPATVEPAAPPPSDDVDMAAEESEQGAGADDDADEAVEDTGKLDEEPTETATDASAADGDESMEEAQEQEQHVEEPAESEPDHPMAGETKEVVIPTFYTPGEGRRGRLRGLSTDAMARKVSDIEARFHEFSEGMKVEDFVAITKDLCGFPSFFNAPFFRRILLTEGGDTTPKPPSSPASGASTSGSPTSADTTPPMRITKDMFQSYWMREMAPCDNVERFFRVVKQPKNDYIERDDFAPFLHELLKYHPGLEFLGGTPEFQEKYALTVVVRIFYSVDRDSSGRITLRKLRRSNLISAFNTVDEEEDINKVNSYFSYEHFYVLYCKFWELDTDHDFLLSPDDLVRYGGHSLTRIIVDRIFERGRRPFARVQTLSAEDKKKMSYEDFIYFMLSEEDKSNPVSLRYWFELIDTNEDGVLRADEMRVFYRHQIHRMECLGHEVVPFEDILCQMSDLLHPEKEGEFYHKDFIRPDKIRVSGVFFNVLFNLSKFIEFEQRDPFLLRQQLAEPELTDWDRYARAEYARLAMEEESRDEDTAMDIDTMDGWYVSDEQEEDQSEGNSSTAEGAAGGNSEGRTVEAPF